MQFNWGLRVTEKKLYITSKISWVLCNLIGDYVSQRKKFI